ncbi:MAG: UxaA family hydrolase [Desulfobacterales bacterium]
MKDSILIINEKDNVAVALQDFEAGEKAAAGDMTPVTILEPVAVAHKIALRDIEAGEKIIKYGETVGKSTQQIKKGAWVHTHNLEGGR